MMGLFLAFFATFFAFTTAHCHVDYPMDKARITQLLGGPGKVGPVQLTPATTLSAMQRICNQFNGCSDWNYTLASVVVDDGPWTASEYIPWLFELQLVNDQAVLSLITSGCPGYYSGVLNQSATVTLGADASNLSLEAQKPNDGICPLLTVQYGGYSSNYRGNATFTPFTGAVSGDCYSFQSDPITAPGPRGAYVEVVLTLSGSIDGASSLQMAI